MTNEELLGYPGSISRLLTGIEKQKRFILQQASHEVPCPNCDHPVNQFAAMRVAVNDYDFNEPEERRFHCPSCKRELLFTLPLVGHWNWRLKPVEVK